MQAIVDHPMILQPTPTPCACRIVMQYKEVIFSKYFLYTDTAPALGVCIPLFNPTGSVLCVSLLKCTKIALSNFSVLVDC